MTKPSDNYGLTMVFDMALIVWYAPMLSRILSNTGEIYPTVV